MYSYQTEISRISNTQHSSVFFHYGCIYIIVCGILFGIGYTIYTKIIQLLKDLTEKYDVKIDKMEIKYQDYIQKLETQIKKLEGKVYENKEYISNLNNQMDYHENQTETLVIDLNNKLGLFKETVKDELENLIVDIKDNSKKNMKNILNVLKSSQAESTIVFTEIYPNNDVYEGTMIRTDSKRIKHGIGKMTYANGDIYSGGWNNDKYHGKGKLYSFNDNKTLTIGEWMNGEPSPNGKSTSYGFGYHSATDISFASTTELKNGKMFCMVHYRRNHSQGFITPDSITHYNRYDNSGNVVWADRMNGKGDYVVIPGESLNLSPGYMFL